MTDEIVIEVPSGFAHPEKTALKVRALWVSEPRDVRAGETFDVSFEWPGEMKKLRWVLVEDAS